MFGIGHMPEIIMLLVVALLIFGPGKVPELGSALGRGIREFRDATNGTNTPTARAPMISTVPLLTTTPAPGLDAPLEQETSRGTAVQTRLVQ